MGFTQGVFLSMDIQTERLKPTDTEIEEEWVRVTNEIDILGVCAVKVSGDWPWRVAIHAAEFARVDPLRAELVEAVSGALRSVPGVLRAEQEDRQAWVLQGQVTGDALVRACSTALDRLAPSLRKTYAALGA